VVQALRAGGELGASLIDVGASLIDWVFLDLGRQLAKGTALFPLAYVDAIHLATALRPVQNVL
jgi:hypothetical protein